MALVWVIALLALVAWVIGVVMFPGFEPWIQAPLLVVGLALAWLAFGRRRQARAPP